MRRISNELENNSIFFPITMLVIPYSPEETSYEKVRISSSILFQVLDRALQLVPSLILHIKQPLSFQLSLEVDSLPRVK